MLVKLLLWFGVLYLGWVTAVWFGVNAWLGAVVAVVLALVGLFIAKWALIIAFVLAVFGDAADD